MPVATKDHNASPEIQVPIGAIDPCRDFSAALGTAPGAVGGQDGSANVAAQGSVPPTLEQARLTLGKWIETQQIISRERNDWQQGKEVLRGRIDLVGNEVAALKERIAQSEATVAESDRAKQELVSERERLKATTAQLDAAVVQMEARIRSLARVMPQPVTSKLQPLLQRIPAEGSAPRVSKTLLPPAFRALATKPTKPASAAWTSNAVAGRARWMILMIQRTFSRQE